MDGEEVRAASRVNAVLPTGDASLWKLKLPFLCACPGNVGVQIDSYRAMKVFNRPRCGKFTEHFLGMQFENSSMENYSRVVERTSKRAQIVEDRLAKLRAREQEILDNEQNRLRKRHEREVARQRKIWLHHQSLKKREQRQREQAAASVIQRCVRGMLTRRERDARLQEQMHDNAARTLQRSSRRFLLCRRNRKCALEKEKERQMQAVTILQRQTRKQLALAARKRLVKLDVPESHRRPSSEKRDVLNSRGNEATANPPPIASVSSVNSPQPPEMGRNISLDLLFSDDEEEKSPMPSLTLTVEIGCSLAQAATTEAKQMSPKPKYQPKRPVSIKRVGGGFRATSFTPTKPPVLARAYAPQQPQQPPQRIVRSQHVVIAVALKRPTQNHPLSLTSRRPSVPSSPPGRGGSRSTGWNAPTRRSGADRAQQVACDLPFDSADDNELAFEELQVHARSHIADESKC